MNVITEKITVLLLPVLLHHLGNLITTTVAHRPPPVQQFHLGRNQGKLLVDHLMRGMQPITGSGKIVAEIPAPQGGRMPAAVCHRSQYPQAQLFKLFSAQPASFNIDCYPKPIGKANDHTLVIEMPQPLHIFKAQIGGPVPDGIVGHVGRIMAPGDV